MDNQQQLWDGCLRLIGGRVDGWTMDTWFRAAAFEGYDERTATVTLAVPSVYVYEYLEHCHAPLLKEALTAAFGPGVHLQYRVRPQAPAQPSVITAAQKPPHITVPDARKRLDDGLHYFLKDRARWLPAYDEVAAWLTDNRGRGLLCVGTSGLGKTLVCSRILPVILGRKIPVLTATEMNARIDAVLQERCVVIDDLGKEPVETITYGNRRTPFFELCDAAEKQGILLIITTNLSTTPVGDRRYPTSIQERYGPEVISRLRAVTTVVEFIGEDLRRGDV